MSQKLELIPVEERCPICKGYGDIWTSWGGQWPVTCGHCNGSGRAVPPEVSP